MSKYHFNPSRRKSVQFLTAALAVPFLHACGGVSDDHAVTHEEATANTFRVMRKHQEAMATSDANAIAADYAVDSVVSTTLASGLVMGRQGVADWVRTNLADLEATLAAPGSTMEMKRFATNGEYGHLVVDLGNGRRATETYHVRGNEILFESATFFLGMPLNYLQQDRSKLDATSLNTLRMMEKHAAAMASNDGDTIAADYAVNAVTSLSITGVFEGFLEGRKGISNWLNKYLPAFYAAMALPDGSQPTMTMKQFIANGEWGHLIVDIGGGRYATETYHVRGNEILFESATFFFEGAATSAEEQATANTLRIMKKHQEAMATSNADTIAADYAVGSVVSTTLASSLVMGRKGVADWVRTDLAGLEAILAAPGSKIEMKKFTTSGEYGHLIVDLGNGRHATETYHVRGNEVLFESATFYLGTPFTGIQQDRSQLDAVSLNTLRVMEKHQVAVAGGNPDAIAADYAVNTVLSISVPGVFDGFVKGRKGVSNWASAHLSGLGAALAATNGSPPMQNMVQFIAAGEWGHLIVDLGGGRHGTETYHVRGNEILFESATFFL